MRFAFFRPNNVGEGILTSIASRLVWEKNVKVAVLRRSYFLLEFLDLRSNLIPLCLEIGIETDRLCNRGKCFRFLAKSGV